MMRHHRRTGAILVYAFFLTFLMAGIVALAVDWGRIQVTKSELRSAADAAARYAVAGLQNDLFGKTAAFTNATASVSQNRANGRPITFVPSDDVEIGVWNTAKRMFTPDTDLSKANACRVTLRCVAARGSAVPLTFLPAIGGRREQDIIAISIAMIDYSANKGGAGNGRYEYFIPATSNPWLAGMPAGTVASDNNEHYNPDIAGSTWTDDGTAKNHNYTSAGFANGGTAGTQSNPNTYDANYANWGSYATKKSSPVNSGGLSIANAQSITFDGINGGANNLNSTTTFTADGNTSADSVWNVPNRGDWNNIYGSKSSGYTNGNDALGAENGIANVHAPINSIIAVFLDDNKPSKYTAPEALDFSTASSRNFTSLAPKLRQPFFVGDGRNDNGEVQQFVPPPGTTRMFIGTMDEYEWSNNKGGFYLTAHAKGRIITVQEERKD